MVNNTNFGTLCLPVQSDSETTTASSGMFKFAACTPFQTHFTHPVTSPGRCWPSTELGLLENSLHPVP